MKHLLLSVIAALAALTARAATVDLLQFQSPLVPGTENVTVITPDCALDGLRRVPTVYLLNGFSGDHLAWIYLRPDLTRLADSYGFVIVCPHGRDSWYWDSPVDSTMRMESYITTELVPYIDAHYPTIPEASKRAVSGLSMGGHGALWLAMRHSDIWGNAGSMSGGVDIRPFPDNWKMKDWLGPKKANARRWDDHTVINLVPSLRPGQLNITFDCGKDDFFAQVNENLHQALLKAGIDHDYTVRPGAHTGKYWHDSLPHHLAFFDQKFRDADKK